MNDPIAEVYLGPCETLMMELLLCDIVNHF